MRQPTSVTGSFFVAALVAGGLLGSSLLSGCQREEARPPSGEAPAASPPVAAPAMPSPEITPSPAAVATPAVSPPAAAEGQPPQFARASADRGKQLFAQNCASCHGERGKGDGPAAVALNPKPQDLTDDQWKYGGSPDQVFNTITKGSPGTAMVSWASIPEEGRWDLVKFILTDLRQQK